MIVVKVYNIDMFGRRDFPVVSTSAVTFPSHTVNALLGLLNLFIYPRNPCNPIPAFIPLIWRSLLTNKGKQHKDYKRKVERLLAQTLYFIRLVR